MKKIWIALVFAGLALPIFAEETNKDDAASPQKEEQKYESDRGDEFRARHIALLQKTLSEIGVTDEQREKIIALQKDFQKKMRDSWIRMRKARNNLSRLQDEGASMEEINAAIQEIADAQTEQLQVLVMNRMEMEKILGKEKNDKFMEIARRQFRQQGRRPSPDMPPRPGMDEEKNKTPPPPPQARAESVPPLPSV